MKNRYKVTGPWTTDKKFGVYMTQSADITDQVNGQLYRDGAYRVVRLGTMKPAKTGKGGTVPFYGETAWMDAERLAGDLDVADRFAR